MTAQSAIIAAEGPDSGVCINAINLTHTVETASRQAGRFRFLTKDSSISEQIGYKYSVSLAPLHSFSFIQQKEGKK
jgi:hypothetical protein